MPSACRSVIANIVGTGGGLIIMPIYVDTNGLNGANGSYRIDGFAAFYLTGYSTPGERRDSVASGRRLCSGSDKCLYGWFTEALVPVGISTGGGSGATPGRPGRRPHR